MNASSPNPLRLVVSVEDIALLIQLAEQYGIRNYDLVAQLYLQIGAEILKQYAEGRQIILRDPKTGKRTILNIRYLIDGALVEDVMRPVRDKQ